MEKSEPYHVKFMKKNILDWIGTLMRDLDAQGTPVTVEDVMAAIEWVLFELDEDTSPKDEDYEDFLRDLGDGRGTE